MLLSVALALSTGGPALGSKRDFNAAFDVIPSPGIPRSMATGDWNGDGRLDLALVGKDAIRVLIRVDSALVAIGDYPVTPSLPALLPCRFLSAADLDGDGTIDLVLNDQYLPGLGNGAFGETRLLDTGPMPGALAVADLDRDGTQDLVVCNNDDSGISGSDSISILMGTGAGAFLPRVALPAAGFGPVSLAVGDLNGDGYPDLVTGNEGSVYGTGFGSLSVFLSVSGTFHLRSDLTQVAAGNVAAVVIGDVDHDGHQDLVFSDPQGGHVSVGRGHGDGTFLPPVAIQGAWGMDLLLADLNGDQFPDLVATQSDAFIVLIGQGDGSFKNVGTTWTAEWAGLLAAGDFDGDARTDILVAVHRPAFGGVVDFAALHLGHGDGTFGREMRSTAPLNQRSVVVGDFDGDARADLACATYTQVATQSGRGDGSFDAPQAVWSAEVGKQLASLASADVDGDGHLDLVVSERGEADFGCACWGPSEVIVLRGRPDGGFDAAWVYEVYGGVPFSAPAPVPGLNLADFDGDGRPDLMVRRPGLDTASVWLNQGEGRFRAVTPVSVPGTGPVATADLNGDGRADVVAPGGVAPHYGVQAYLASAGGAFDPPLETVLGTYASAIATGDLDGDHVVDLAVVGASNAVFVLHGRGDGRFDTVATLDGGEPTAIAIVDVLGDASPDIVTLNPWRATVAVLKDVGGSFDSKLEFGAGEYPTLFAVAALNGDSRRDLLVANSTTRTWSALINTSDFVTTVLISNVAIEFVRGAVHVRWLTSLPVLRAVVARRSGSGPWVELGDARDPGNGWLDYVDPDVQPGTYGYRVSITSPSGEAVSSEATIEVPSTPAPALAIRAVLVRAGSQSWTLHVSVPQAGVVHADLLDLAGRRMAGSDFVFREPGARDVELRAHGPVRSGVYFARIRQGGRAAFAKVVITL